MGDRNRVSRREVLKNLSAAATATTVASAAATAQPTENEVPEGMDFSHELQDTLDISNQRKRELTSEYDSSSEVEEAIVSHASLVLDALVDRDIISASDPYEFPIDQIIEDRMALGTSTDIEGTAVSAINYEEDETAILTSSMMVGDSRNTRGRSSSWVTLFVLPQIGRSYALIKYPTGKVEEIEPEPEVQAQDNCEDVEGGCLGYEYTDCTTSFCWKGAARPGHLGTKKTEWACGNCTYTTIQDTGCIC